MNLLLILLTTLASFLTGLETKTLQTDFVITITEKASQPMNYTGSMTMHGELFRLTALNMEAAYDGKTLYLLDTDIKELTLSSPTEAELIEANPFLFAKALDENGQQVNVKMGDNDLPVRAELFDGGKTYTITFRNAKYITTPVDYTITPTPDIFVNDIR